MPMVRTVTRLTVLLFLTFTLALPLCAQDVQQGVAPVQLTVKPQTVSPGAMVTMSGWTAVDGKSMSVAITVTPPSGPPVSLSAKAQPSGDFTLSGKAGQTLGIYQVKAVSPNGKGSATGSFTVVGAAGSLELAEKTVDALVSTAVEGGQVTADLIATLPASPAKDEAQQKLDQLNAKLKEAPQQAAKAKEGLDKIAQIPKQYPETAPGLEPLTSAINAWQDEAKAENEKLKQQIARSKQKGVVCDQIDAASEALNAVSVALNLIGQPWKIALHFAQDKVVPDKLFSLLPATSRDSGAKFAIAESLKAGEALLGGPSAWAGFAFGFTVDLSQFMVSKVFDKYCEKFQGPVSATFRAEFTDGGNPLWNYDVNLEGRIVLRFAKGASGEAVHLSGQIEGTATKFTLWDNFIILDPRWKGNVLFHRAYHPPGFPYVPQAGTVPGALVPTSFYMRVEGEYVKDKITLDVGDAVMDYPKAAKGQVAYIFVDFVTLIPQVITVSVPYQGAQFIFSRGMRKGATFDVKSGKSKWMFWSAPEPATIEKVFTRKETGKDFVVTWNVKVKACNPECP